MAKHVVKILGRRCGSCVWTERLVREAVERLGIDATVEKVTDTSAMLPYEIMATPAVVIDEAVVHAGGLPKKEDVERWLRALA